MRKGYFALIGAVALILASVLVIGLLNNITGITDKLGDVISDASKDTSNDGFLDVPGETSSDGSVDVPDIPSDTSSGGSSGDGSVDIPDIPSDTSSGGFSGDSSGDSSGGSSSTSSPDVHVIQLGDSDIVPGYAMPNTSKGVIVCGFKIENLKPNTTYRMDWAIDSAVFDKTNATYITEMFDGKTGCLVFVDTSYSEGGGLGKTFFAGNGEVQKLLTGNYGDGITFTTESSTDEVLIWFFAGSWTTQEAALDLSKAACGYVTKLTFTEQK